MSQLTTSNLPADRIATTLETYEGRQETNGAPVVFFGSVGLQETRFIIRHADGSAAGMTPTGNIPSKRWNECAAEMIALHGQGYRLVVVGNPRSLVALLNAAGVPYEPLGGGL